MVMVMVVEGLAGRVNARGEAGSRIVSEFVVAGSTRRVATTHFKLAKTGQPLSPPSRNPTKPESESHVSLEWAQDSLFERKKRKISRESRVDNDKIARFERLRTQEMSSARLTLITTHDTPSSDRSRRRYRVEMSLLSDPYDLRHSMPRPRSGDRDRDAGRIPLCLSSLPIYFDGGRGASNWRI